MLWGFRKASRNRVTVLGGIVSFTYSIQRAQTIVCGRGDQAAIAVRRHAFPCMKSLFSETQPADRATALAGLAVHRFIERGLK
jgi:hypothetical protein